MGYLEFYSLLTSYYSTILASKNVSKELIRKETNGNFIFFFSSYEIFRKYFNDSEAVNFHDYLREIAFTNKLFIPEDYINDYITVIKRSIRLSDFITIIAKWGNTVLDVKSWAEFDTLMKTSECNELIVQFINEEFYYPFYIQMYKSFIFGDHFWKDVYEKLPMRSVFSKVEIPKTTVSQILGNIPRKWRRIAG